MYQELAGTGYRDVEVTTYDGSSEWDKDISCCKKCDLNKDCEYWVRATDSNHCWLKSNNGKTIEASSSSNRRGGFRASAAGTVFEGQKDYF